MTGALMFIMRIIESFVSRVDKWTRERIGDAFIELGRDIKRGQVVSDDEINATLPHLDRTRSLQERAKS